jgi:hypothetical protein
MNKGDAESERVARIRRGHLLSAQLHAAAILGQNAAKNVHRRRLTRAILTNQSEDSPTVQLKSDVAEHRHAEEALVEPGDFQKEVGHRLASRHQIVADRVRDGRHEDDAPLDRIDR